MQWVKCSQGNFGKEQKIASLKPLAIKTRFIKSDSVVLTQGYISRPIEQNRIQK